MKIETIGKMPLSAEDYGVVWKGDLVLFYCPLMLSSEVYCCNGFEIITMPIIAPNGLPKQPVQGEYILKNWGFHTKTIDEGLEPRNPSYDKIKCLETIFKACANAYGREKTTKLLDWFNEWMTIEQLVE